MITNIGTVTIFVKDQAKARDFFVNTLGFEVRSDTEYSAEQRWLTVAPPGTKTEIVLYVPDENWEHYRQVIGQMQALTFTVQDIQALYADLSAKGVAFAAGPQTAPWGTFLVMSDPDGNRFLLVEGA